MATYGLTPQGFKIKRQAIIKKEVEDTLRDLLGKNINLLPETVLGQWIGVQSEREALIWELAEAVYLSYYPGGAEGTSVDNLLAFNNLKRLGALPTKTAPITNGVYGLEFFGDAGTIIPANSLISIFGQAQFQFATREEVTIQAAVDCAQLISFTSTPTTGSWTLSIVNPDTGNELTTGALAYNISNSALQIAIRALADGLDAPYDDVIVTGNFASGFSIAFDGDSGNKAQPLFVVASNTLFNGVVFVNVTVIMITEGTPAKGVGSAWCTINGPVYAPAGSLTVINSPISGWDSVNNPLDAITGRNIETDTEALIRRLEVLSAGASASVQAIAADVAQIEGVEKVTPFENLDTSPDNSVQAITFSGVPTSGDFTLRLGGPTGVITDPINYNDDAADIQQVIRDLGSPFDTVVVSGTFASGFFMFFDSVSEDRVLVETNTLQKLIDSVNIGISGRPGKSFEIVVEGGDDVTIANTIYENKPAGIKAYGALGPFEFTDEFEQTHQVYFSRPSPVEIYVSITLDVDQEEFPVDGIQQIQKQLIAIGNSLRIGQKVILYGSKGLIGAFNDVPGIVDYELYAGAEPAPASQDNIEIRSQQRAHFSSQNIIVTLNYV